MIDSREVLEQRLGAVQQQYADTDAYADARFLLGSI